MPLISVIMPFRNSEKYLESAIKSVLGQTYENFELILCNDSSEDRSEKIVQHFNDRRIIYLRNSKQMGISASRNLCLMHSKGTYIAVLDSDDISLPFRLERQLAFMERNTDNILCGTHFIQFNEKGLLDKGDSPAHSDEEIRSQFIFSNCILHSSLMFRRTIGSDIKYDESMEVCEDFDLIYRLGKLGKMTIIPETMTYYRLHKTNTIFQQKTKMDQFKRIMFERVLNDWNIDFSAEEMQIHTKFLLSDKELFCTPLARYSLENWIRHLEDQTRYNSSIVQWLIKKNITDRWMEICLKNKDWKGMFEQMQRPGYKNAITAFLSKKFRNKIHGALSGLNIYSSVKMHEKTGIEQPKPTHLNSI